MTPLNNNDQTVPEYKTIKTADIRVGMYVKIDLPWLKHPFARKEFKITSEQEIETMKRYGIEELSVDVSRSDMPRADMEESGEINSEPHEPAEPRESARQSAGKSSEDAEFKERILKKRKLLENSKQVYVKTRETVENIFSETLLDPSTGISSSRQLIENMSEQVSQDPETFVHLITLKFKREFIQFHSLNVCVISLILGRSLKLQPGDMRTLGIGALFHDIGKKSLPEQLVMKKAPYSRLENSIIMTHCQRGKDLLAKANEIPEKVITVAHQHHESMDGTGYPRGLKDKYIDGFSKIVAVANIYENLTNPFNIDEMMLPHQALSFIYKNLKDKLPSVLIDNLVKCMGVYPPGSLVELDDGRVGVVISINKRSTMKPTLIIFEKGASKNNPLLIDLDQERNCKIRKALQISELSDEAIEYLEPGKRKGYTAGIEGDEPDGSSAERPHGPSPHPA